MTTTAGLYTSKRSAITNSLADVLNQIDGSLDFNTDVSGNVFPRMKFWDEVKEFPAIHLSAGTEIRVYQGGGYKDRVLSMTVRCYVKSENSVDDLEGLLADVEFVIENNGRLAYQDRQGVSQTTHDIRIVSIDTDEGILSPLGVGDIILQVQY